MTWNHRVIRTDGPNGETAYGIHEVYYNDAGEPYGWTASPMTPYGDTLEELVDDLVRMKAACRKPVLMAVGDKVEKLVEVDT